MTRFWLSASLTLLLAAPAAAEPALLLPAGSAGAVLPYRLSGPLGTSGLTVEATPTMLLVKAVTPGSSAALADVPAPGGERVRIAAVNGRPVERLQRHELLQAFHPARGQVALTFACKREEAPAERLVGPYTVELAAGAIAERELVWLLAQGRYDQVLKRLKARPEAAESIADRLLLAAQDMARSGAYGQAMALATHVPSGHPGYAEARKLYARTRLSYVNEVLERADALASAGQYPAALAALRGVPLENGWGKRRQDREAAWKAALVERAAYQKAKAASAKEKERMQRSSRTGRRR